MRGLLVLCFAPLSLTQAFSQSFDAASVEISPHSTTQFPRGGGLRDTRYDIKNATMVDLISRAYGVDADLVVGGPNWLELDRFDVIAKAPAKISPEDLRIMLQALLAARFKLVLHRDTKPVAGFALIAQKRLSIKKSEGSDNTGCRLSPNTPNPQGPPTYTYACHNVTLAAFAEEFKNRIPFVDQFLDGQRVVDRTDLEGTWDFSFKYTMPAALIFRMGDAITLQDALEKQLGLKLEPAQIPMPVLVVDSVNRQPTPNAADIAELLHIEPPATEFEVADVKLADPNSRRSSSRIQAGGRVNITGQTLRSLIVQAWDTTPVLIAGEPKWSTTDRYDIIAKAPSSAEALDRDSMRPMLRALLADRFKLATHMEDRPVNAYALVAAKPKLKAADPAGRTHWQQHSEMGPGDVPIVTITVQNMTMAQFAENLRAMAPSYIITPVLDSTGLEGAWDFTLRFSQFNEGPTRIRRGEDDLPAADPTGTITLMEAVEKQLGLKLQLQKRTLPVLVIDHVEQKPTEN